MRLALARLVMVVYVTAGADVAFGVENEVNTPLLPIFLVEIDGRRKLLLPSSWWSIVDMGTAGSFRIILTFTIMINTSHTYIR